MRIFFIVLFLVLFMGMFLSIINGASPFLFAVGMVAMGIGAVLNFPKGNRHTATLRNIPRTEQTPTVMNSPFKETELSALARTRLREKKSKENPIDLSKHEEQQKNYRRIDLK